MKTWIWLWLAAAAAAQPADATLEKIVARVRENQARLPNYTCGQTIQRWNRGDRCPTCEWSDRLRVDVAVIGDRELFAWPGEGTFEEGRGLFELGDERGLALEGNYASLVRGVFLMDDAVYTRQPETLLAGRPSLRYDYRLLGRRVAMRVRVGDREAELTYEGSFWADAATLDLLRLEVRLTGIPEAVGLKSAKTTIDYERVRIGGADFVLPAAAETEAATRRGAESRNRTRFAECRQYVASSSIRYEEAGEGAGTAARAPQESVPAGLKVAAALREPVDFSRCAAGDELTFTTLEEVSRDGFRLPRGALLRGRILGYAALPAAVQFYWRVSSAEFDGRRLPFPARLHSAGETAFFSYWLSVGRARRGAEPTLTCFPKDRSEIAKGTKFTWITVPREKP